MSEDYTLENRINTQYYIDTYGDIHKYHPSEDEIKTKDVISIYDIISVHEELAKQILIKISGNSDYSPFHSAKSLIARMGYIIVGSLGQPLPFCIREPTQAQIDKLFELDYIIAGTRPHTDDIGRITTEHFFKIKR